MSGTKGTTTMQGREGTGRQGKGNQNRPKGRRGIQDKKGRHGVGRGMGWGQQSMRTIGARPSR